jgi:ubiquinone/menaquinone biosynthesis C-methylase UbiE
MSLTLRQRWRHFSGRLVFDSAAWFYAWMTWQATWRRHCASMADYFPPALTDSSGRKLAVLDAGIGPGVSGIGLLDRRPDLWVIGLDYVRGMLDQARGYLRRASCTLDLVQADVSHLPFADGSFDIVTHHSFLYLISDRSRALDELARVLRPGGAYVILEPNRQGSLVACLRTGGELRFKLSMLLWRLWSGGAGRFSPDELARLLLAHGFTDVHIDLTLGGLGLLCRARRRLD